MNKSWPKVRLGDVLRPVSRFEAVDASKEYRLLGVRLEGRGPFLRETVSGSLTAATRLNRVEAGDFIYSRLFAGRGAFGLIPNELHGCYVSGEFPTYLSNEERLDLHFLRYWLWLPATINTVEEDCSGSTPLTRNRFKEEFFRALEIPLPSLAEQRRIVARIDDLAAHINKTDELRHQIEMESDALLLSTFGEITKQVPFKKMDEVAPLVRRPVAIVMDEEYPELGIRCFGKGTFVKPALDFLSVGSKKMYRIEPGDLVFSNVFAWEGGIAVAKTTDIGRYGSHRFITCVPRPGKAIAEFLCYYLLTQEGLEKIGKASPGGAGRNRTLGLEKLANIEVPVPAYKNQIWFRSLVDEIGGMKRRQAEIATELNALLPSILGRAFSGAL